MKNKKGFTLIELLIVIGILSVLAVTLLLALNPAEAQKRTRDTKRLKDAVTLQAILNQYLESGAPLSTCLTSTAGCTSATYPPTPHPCAADSNWLYINVCAYAQQVPLDPNNGQKRTFISGGGFTAPTEAIYRAKIVGSDYEVNVYQEADANRSKVTSMDGGTSDEWFEVFSNAANIL